MNDDAELRERTRQTAQMLFHSLKDGTYGGMPVVVDALDVFKGVLKERGEWEP